MQDNILNYKISFQKLENYCTSEKFKGWDPYDGLNSHLFQKLKLGKFKLARLIWIQVFKRSPINFRRLAGVEKDYNPKGLGLFLTAYCNMYKLDAKKEYYKKIIFFADKLVKLKSDGYSGACWGYNFDWQSRAFFLPKSTPTVVATSFIASALLDAYDITKVNKYLKVAISSSNFILNDLNRTYKDNGFIFSYSPMDNTCVYNASLLGSKILAKIYKYTNDETLLMAARKSIMACVNAQRDDGSWLYGELEVQQWVDSFHTGYNLECIHEYQKFSGDLSFQSAIDKGVSYYLSNFFLADGTPKYYDNKVYPIDIHSPAQFIVTIYKLNLFKTHKSLIDKVLEWTIINMQDEQEGYFYYQLKQKVSSKIPYMRWAEAWMLYAFSFYFLGDSDA